MRRHEISFVSLLSAIVFGALAVALLATDGRFGSVDVPWAVIWSVVAGVAGVAIVAAAATAIARERRDASDTDE
jgi:hypothetical protein